MNSPATMNDAELRAALLRLSLERSWAGPKRREVIGRVMDVCLDELNERKEQSCTPSSSSV